MRLLFKFDRSTIALTALAIAGFVLCYVMAIPFIPALVWSATLAILLDRLHQKAKRGIGSPDFAALATVVVIGLVVVGPAIFLITALLNEAARSSSAVASWLTGGNVAEVLSSHPWLSRLWETMNQYLNVPDLLQSIGAGLTEWSGALVKSSVFGALTLILTFYFLFFLLRDKEPIIAGLKEHLPLSHAEFAVVAGRTVDTVFATVWGTLAVAAIQGALGGLIFWWLGLPAPIFWGVLMALVAIVPFLGAFLIWAPAAAYLALTGQYGSSLILIVWGTLVIGLVDNLLYPMLVGNRLKLHTLVAFGAVVGGVMAFGAHGLVLGPFLVSVTLALAEIYQARSSHEQRALGTE